MQRLCALAALGRSLGANVQSETITKILDLLGYGGFPSHGGAPKSSKSVDDFSIETCS